MATQVQLRRGTSAQNDAFTGATGELTYDTTNKRVRVHDGGTAGGFEIKTEDGSGNTIFADNEKAIFGAGDDLQIYHDGSRSIIQDNGTGNLRIQANNLELNNADNSENYLFAANNGAVTLYYDNAEKLATTSTGIDVTGTAKIENSGQALNLDTPSASQNVWMNFSDNGSAKWEIQKNTANLLNIYSYDLGSNVMTLNGSGNVGIGTSSPDTTLDVEGAGDCTISITANSTSHDSKIDFVQGSTIEGGITYDHNGSYASEKMAFRAGNNGTHMYLTGDGKLGIGTASPADPLHTYLASGQRVARFEANSSVSAHIAFRASNTSFMPTVGVKDEDLYFSTGDAVEAMRIDSSGNLLVGKTSSGIGTAGIELRANDDVLITSNGSQALYLNRLSSNGAIAEFRKDGSVVGSIGTVGSVVYIGSAESNLRFNFGSGQAVIPATSAGAVRDNVIDLGESSARFDDIYATNGTIQTSDQNEKNTITDSDLGIDFIKRLTPKSYGS